MQRAALGGNPATGDMAGHSVGCTLAARNAGGNIEMFTPRIGRLVIR